MLRKVRVKARGSADPARIKQVSLAEHFGSLGKERTLLCILGFKCGQVQNRSIKLGLPEIRDQNHVERKSIVDAVFQVHSAVKYKFRFAVVIIQITGEIGLKGKSGR